MKPHQTAKLKEGTALADVCIRMIKACMAAGIGFSCENPESSMMWHYPPMREIMMMKDIIVVDLVYCAFGMPWMKPTRLITNIPSLAALRRTCTRDHEHQPLRGASPSGVLWTRLACAYPPLFCEAYSTAMSSALKNGEIRVAARPAVEELGKCELPRPRRRRVWANDVQENWHPAERWSLEWKGVWKYEEHINIQEARTVAMLAKHLARALEGRAGQCFSEERQATPVVTQRLHARCR